MGLSHRQFTKEFKLAAVRRLEAGVSLAEVLEQNARTADVRGQQGCSKPSPGALVILTEMRTPAESPERLSFLPRCGVIEATRENLAAARKGVQQDFGPRY